MKIDIILELVLDEITSNIAVNGGKY